MSSDIDQLECKDDWTGLKSLGIVESTREIKGGCSCDKTYCPEANT